MGNVSSREAAEGTDKEPKENNMADRISVSEEDAEEDAEEEEPQIGRKCFGCSSQVTPINDRKAQRPSVTSWKWLSFCRRKIQKPNPGIVERDWDEAPRVGDDSKPQPANASCISDPPVLQNFNYRSEKGCSETAASISSSHSSHAAEDAGTQLDIHIPSNSSDMNCPESDNCQITSVNLSDVSDPLGKVQLRNSYCRLEEDHHIASSQRRCKSCAEVPDSSWVLVKPNTSTERSISTYHLSSSAGSYECSESGLRWSCAAPVTLQYHFIDWHLLADELPHMQYRPAGPSMDIKLISGELEEIHLPHFLCLGANQSFLEDAVKVLHKMDNGVYIEKYKLSRFHARLVKPSLSPLGVFYSLKTLLFPRKVEIDVHADVLVYRSTIFPLTFRTYLLPVNASLTELVEKQEKSEGFRGFRLARPRPVRRLQMNSFYFYSLKTNCESRIYPVEVELIDCSFVPNFSEVLISKGGDFEIQLLSSVDKQEVWHASIRGIECWDNPPQSNMNICTEAPNSSLSHTANIQPSVEAPTINTNEIDSGSSNPVQPASVSSSIMAQSGAVALSPSLSANTFYGPVSFSVSSVDSLLNRSPEN